jgi:hypothetical protein
VQCYIASITHCTTDVQVDKANAWIPTQIRVIVNALRMKQLMGTPSLSSAQEALALFCTQLYASWKPATESCGPTEFGVGEEAIEMAVGALLSAYACEPHLKYIVQVWCFEKLPACMKRLMATPSFSSAQEAAAHCAQLYAS